MKSTSVLQITHLSVHSNISDWKVPGLLLAQEQEGHDSEYIFVTFFCQHYFVTLFFLGRGGEIIKTARMEQEEIEGQKDILRKILS